MSSSKTEKLLFADEVVDIEADYGVGHGATPVERPQPALQASRDAFRTRTMSMPVRRGHIGLKGYLRNSFFVKRLLWTTLTLFLLDGAAFGYYGYYMYQHVDADWWYEILHAYEPVVDISDSCAKWLKFGWTVYCTAPFVLFLGITGTGFRCFDLFKRASPKDEETTEHRMAMQRISQKVQRTWYLQACEMICSFLMLYQVALLILGVITLVQSQFMAHMCAEVPAIVFCAGAIVTYIVMIVQITYFTRLRDHLKMQLGAFKEGELTGKAKAEPAMLDANTKLKKLVAEVKKRLYTAAELGNVEDLRQVLVFAQDNLGHDFAAQHYGSARLHWFFNFSKKNPMHVAAMNGNVVMLQLLYDAGFSVNALDKVARVRLSTGDFFWYLSQVFVKRVVISADESAKQIFKTTLVSPLHCAVSASRVDAVQWLIDHGSDVNQVARSTVKHERVPPIFFVDHPTIMEMLLVANADHLHVPDPGGMNTVTALELAYLRGNYAVGAVLEDWGGDVALTPLHLAAGLNNVRKVKKILKYCIPDCLGEYGYSGFNRRTPLHWAAVSGSTDTLHLLLEKGANPNFQDAGGRTPLHWAARCNRVEAVQRLLRYGANPSIRDHESMTPILAGAYADNLSQELLSAMVTSGGNINDALADSGDAALHIAMKRGKKATALALLGAGADVMQVNGDGCRPLDCTTSTELQFAVKRAAGSRDVMISYTHSHMEFAKKLRTSLENNHITTWLDLMDPSGIGGGSVWREEIARGISSASCVVSILTEDYPKSEWCLKELALAKQVGTPVLALSTENVKIGEELQVYLYARQIVPFESAITAVEKSNPRNITYEYNEAAFARQFRSLLDGVRDEIEKKRQALATKSGANLGWTMVDTFLNNKTSSEAENAPFVFVASGDMHEDFVRQLYTELNPYCRVYVDHPSPDGDMTTRIHAAKEAILKCSCFIIVLSAKNQNELIQDQLAFAEDKGKTILPIMLSDPTSYLGLAHQYTLSRNEVYHFAQNLGFASSMKSLMGGVRKAIPNGKRRVARSVLSPHTLMEPQDSIRWSFSSSHANTDL
ncbi:hypothetical protein SDRG_09247 [Saprolegnia diclina VS20]|uniref:TIR domain-containing protein n=1 Tax=Saprolegnia diclina (strain VS20) TaxID=1156394 RepID=T0QHT5_SAPDV|nr:hypothetical protein SDRG_09247 [Saprolegnia diclina VS20]EQC33265.1 hypothetical protein SDRG_09247 [Saprolegnia diclina VS20]|eukprot:XP_008613388.1 hypothetical protein SDRG_09247 [Saprolegnia diclina VS20]